MFSSRPGDWLALVVGGLVFVAFSSADAGLVRTEAMTNTCPRITQVSVSPMKASVGDDIDVSAAVTDNDGDPIAYLWASTGGSFVDPAAQSTTYTCEAPGNHSITVTVSDPDACTATWTAQVTCLE